MALGLVIRKRMKQKNIGNKELSEMTGISLSTINNVLYETTKDPSVNIITSIAKVLDCSIDELVEDMENPEHLTSSEDEMLELYRSVNEEGQYMIKEYVRYLISTGRYMKNNHFGFLE